MQTWRSFFNNEWLSLILKLNLYVIIFSIDFVNRAPVTSHSFFTFLFVGHFGFALQGHSICFSFLSHLIFFFSSFKDLLVSTRSSIFLSLSILFRCSLKRNTNSVKFCFMLEANKLSIISVSRNLTSELIFSSTSSYRFIIIVGVTTVPASTLTYPLSCKTNLINFIRLFATTRSSRPDC